MTEPDPLRVDGCIVELFGHPDSDVPGALDLMTPERTPIVRTGEREPIPDGIRRAVWNRDGRHCTWCGSADDLQLDHIVPWSAGGSDRSDNLRLLCERCNTARSNYRTDMSAVRVLPVAAQCVSCSRLEYPDSDIGLVKAYCAHCRHGGLAEQQWIL